MKLLESAGSGISDAAIDEASAWFVEFRLGEVDAKARERFIEWLRVSPMHIRAYLEIAGTYAEMGPPEARAHVDVAGLIAAARAESSVIELPVPTARVQAQAQSGSPRIGKPHRARLWALAASVLALTVGLYLWQGYFRETYSTQIGEQRSLTLSDGSRIDLNARSRIRIRMSSEERRIELLDGQALFHVARDVTRPFVVHATGTTVRAVGTSFDINRGPGGITVTVLEGRVAARSAAEPKEILLSAGEQLRVPAVVAALAPKPVNVAAVTAWTQHSLVFEGTPLQDVIEQFNRYNERQIVIDDRALDTFQVSGYYATPDPASLLNFLRSEPHIDVIESGDAVHIARR